MEPLVRRVKQVCDHYLAPRAEEVAAGRVSRAALDELAEAGVFGLSVYQPAAPFTAANVQREVTELLAAADASTWFVTAQHHHPLREVAGADGPRATAGSRGWRRAG
ncbi:acyl-CoA dehydrogenase family protein [Streptacidiphilus sp. 4-A2]|nr:acyl-CoA dehydrogenase family protein [Streptacidiphilus sp. 4-A2]